MLQDCLRLTRFPSLFSSLCPCIQPTCVVPTAFTRLQLASPSSTRARSAPTRLLMGPDVFNGTQRAQCSTWSWPRSSLASPCPRRSRFCPSRASCSGLANAPRRRARLFFVAPTPLICTASVHSVRALCSRTTLLGGTAVLLTVSAGLPPLGCRLLLVTLGCLPWMALARLERRDPDAGYTCSFS